jgi:hypothetical protein
MIDHECFLPVNQLKGEYVKLKKDAKKVWKVDGFDKTYKMWVLIDCDDISNYRHVKPKTKLFAGFTY